MSSISSGLHRVARRFFRSTYGFWERLGFHVTPNHFYEVIPDSRALDPKLWDKPSALPGIDLNEAGQCALVAEIAAAYQSEYQEFPRNQEATTDGYYLYNTAFSTVDAEMLYGLVRLTKPRRLLEIGSGFSTLVAARALAANRLEHPDRPATFTAIEPYPNALIRPKFPGLGTLISEKVEQVPLSLFEELEAGDILFIDSSHVLKLGSDVQYEFLEVLPRLKKGVLVHVHDIFLPYEYPREWVLRDRRFWNEQYLLQAFLAFNSAFSVVWGSYFMHRKNPEKVQAAFPSYSPAQAAPASFWFRKTA